ncbi:nicotinate phosphoribosyltransferase [Enhygromyxa salina]|uniref:Nicotinate phosphoribosyltransferase n=1 Tax=Enhygromyxa salina TaxID=215803 RepID=A0A2S9XL26_9BACT|nr:nicotinate phosphoribosyltransferase [Enhygromyxa salina]PRP93565.1 Nicotinate phosphoribosyltransferase pncB2 [Enhygromyxa salina]
MTSLSPTGLQTDLYQLTMAQGHWALGRTEEESVFHLGFRKHPFKAGFSLACGLQQAVELIEDFGYSEPQLTYLSRLTGNDGKRLFDPGFLEWLGLLRPSVDLDAMPEGTACFAHEPLLRVRGPLGQAQLLETALLTIVNFQTLIATKAARIVTAARGGTVLEFGLRRAQGLDGGLSASRAAYIGGCAATSNVAAGMRYEIPIKGTHAHSWVMSFAEETEAFAGYAKVMPNNCVFLVDTYDTLRGVDRAIAEAVKLRDRGFEMVGIRLDSGDLAALSKAAPEKLDAAGFPDASVVASSDLDEYRITALQQAGARIDVWGVGTRLATAYDQPALGGVYKLSALRARAEQPWRRMVKLSDTPIKTSIPGILQVRRLSRGGVALVDVVYDEEFGPPAAGAPASDIDPRSDTPLNLPAGDDITAEDLLVPVLRAGKRVTELPSATQIRAYAQAQLERLPPSLRLLEGHTSYPVALEPQVAALKRELIAQADKPAAGQAPGPT